MQAIHVIKHSRWSWESTCMKNTIWKRCWTKFSISLVGRQSRVCISTKWTRRHLLFNVFLFEHISALFFLSTLSLSLSHTEQRTKKNNNIGRLLYLLWIRSARFCHCTNDVCLVPFLSLVVVGFLLLLCPCYCQKIIWFGILFIISVPASIVLCPFALYFCILVWDIGAGFFYYFFFSSTDELDLLL